MLRYYAYCPATATFIKIQNSSLVPDGVHFMRTDKIRGHLMSVVHLARI